MHGADPVHADASGGLGEETYPVQLQYNPEAIGNIRWGFERTGPSHGWNRWFIYADGEWLNFRRGWALGQLCYRARLNEDGVSEIQVSNQFPKGDHPRHLTAVQRIIEVLLIGEPFCPCGASLAVPVDHSRFQCARCQLTYDPTDMEDPSPPFCVCGVPLARQIPESRKRFRCYHCHKVWNPAFNMRPEDLFTATEATEHGVLGWGKDEVGEIEIIPVQFAFSPDDMERIRWGFRAQMMEERWFIYAEDEWLNFFRVGGLFFRARLTPNGVDELHVTALARRGMESWGGASNSQMTSLVRQLIDGRLIGGATAQNSG